MGRESGLPGLLFPGARGVGRAGIGPGTRKASGGAAGARQAGVEEQAGRAAESLRGGPAASSRLGGFHGDSKQASTASATTAKSPGFHPPLGALRAGEVPDVSGSVETRSPR